VGAAYPTPPYSPEQVCSVTLLADAGRLWLAVTAVVPIEHHDLEPGRVGGVDLGIIHPYAVVTDRAGLLVSGRALRAEHYLHLEDQRIRQAKAAGRAPRPGQRGSRRWRQHRARVRRAEARHRRRVHQAQHQAAKQVVAFAVQQRVGTLLVGDPKGITEQLYPMGVARRTRRSRLRPARIKQRGLPGRTLLEGAQMH
jgi:transposase